MREALRAALPGEPAAAVKNQLLKLWPGVSGPLMQALAAKGNSAYHVEVVTGRARRVLLNGCVFRYYSDISASKVQSHLNELRKDTKDKRGISAQTYNFHVQALTQFCRWMVQNKRAGENPVTGLGRLSVETDRRHDRRELTADELQKVLRAAMNSERAICGLKGQERGVLYATAAGTGFRASALASLTSENFDLDAYPPTVTLAAQFNKNRKPKVQPLPPELVALLRDYLRNKPANQPLWSGNWARDKRGAEMLRIDLEAADIPYIVEGPDGPLHADFHALRHSFLTRLGKGGVDCGRRKNSPGIRRQS